MARAGKKAPKNDNGATVGYEAQLWQMADALRGSMDAAEYKHVVLGLIFLKYISDAFEEQHARLTAERSQGADPEDPDEYRALNIFWVPPEARWAHLKTQAKQPVIGRLVDDAMVALERDNPSLKGVLPKDYARPALDKTRLGQLIDLISNIRIGDEEARAKDVLGRVYEYFLSQFASAEGKKGGEFYTPRCVVKLLVEMLEPYRGRVYDPCCGSSGMFVQSVEFIRAHASGNGNGGKAKADISIYGQESNYTTWRLAKMNLAIRGIEGQIAHGDTFHNDRHPDLKADFILANPPFNISDWGGERLKDDRRWRHGTPPARNANYAWVQHIVHHLAPAGIAGFVLANGSMSSNQSGEGEIRKNLIETGLVDCMVALPGQLFYSTQIPACLWFLARDRKNGKFRDRRGEVLFIDARKMGRMVDRTHRELTDEDIQRIAGTYHAWRAQPVGAGLVPAQPVGAGLVPAQPVGAGLVPAQPVGAGLVPAQEGDHKGRPYEDIPGFCKSATLQEVRKHGHILTPGPLTPLERITQSIPLIRGHKVMPDADLDELYGIETGALRGRFAATSTQNSMFQLT
ncbi:type I restriction enzyme EcoKI M protein [bacterium BMS3Bbin12]|nr:type I restriction enzyme EcoKI M protein [bacterium BMS3Bbin12]GBE51540.1 type I restriction enzyme EcoKI M protein [bacterium BMS3Bbin13]